MSAQPPIDRLLKHIDVLPPIFRALYISDIDALTKELATGKCDPNEIYYKHVPLHSAIHKKSIPIIDLLLQNNACPFIHPTNHLSPFQLATYLEIKEQSDLHIAMWDKLTRTIWEPQIYNIPIVSLEGPLGPKSYTVPDKDQTSFRNHFLNSCNLTSPELSSHLLFITLLEKNDVPHIQKSLAAHVKMGINIPAYDFNHCINKPRNYSPNFLYEKHIPYCDLGIQDEPLAGKIDSLVEPCTIYNIQHPDDEMQKIYRMVIVDYVLGFPHMFIDETYSKIFSSLLTGFKTSIAPKLNSDYSAVGLGGILCHLWKEACLGHLFMRVITLTTLPLNCDVFINEEIPNIRKCYEEMFEFFKDNLIAMDLILRQFLFSYESFEKSLYENCPVSTEKKRLFKFQQSVFGPIRAAGVVFLYKFNQMVSLTQTADKHAHLQSLQDALYKMRNIANRFSLLTEVITHNPDMVAKVDKRDLFFFLSSELNQKLFCYKGKRGLIYTDPETPLFIAAKKKDIPTCTELLLAGAYPFTVDYEGKMFFNFLDGTTQEVKDFLETCPAIQKPFPLKTLCAQLYLKDKGLDGLRYLRSQRPLYEFVMLHVRSFSDEDEYREFTMIT